MTALLALLRSAWPYLLTGGLGLGAGIWATHKLDGASYDALQARFASYQRDVADADAKAQKAASDALQAQINTRLATEANNGKVIQQLQAERDSAAADRDFARRLLAAAQAVPTAADHSGTAAAGGSAAPDPARPPGDRPLAQDLGDAAGECRDAIQRLAALQVELQPQLRTPP